MMMAGLFLKKKGTEVGEAWSLPCTRKSAKTHFTDTLFRLHNGG